MPRPIMNLAVVKVGGAALAQRGLDQAEVLRHGHAVVVHGAGPRISSALAVAGLPSRFVDGRRVTSDEAMPYVRAAFCEENAALCGLLGERALGLIGDELGLEADHVPALGRVGILRPFVPAALRDVLDGGRLPVIAPLARGPLNVNADDAASVLAVALGADRLAFVSDVPGVQVGRRVARLLSADDVAALGGQVSAGMVAKLQAAVAAAREGVEVRVGATLVTA
jgi:acetylglutamate kinase